MERKYRKEESNKTIKESKIKQGFFLSIYYISPIITSIIYWFQEPVLFSLNSSDLLLNLLYRTGSILGIFSYIWLCFNIIVMIKIKMIEENFSLDRILKFHTRMSVIALLLGTVHYPLLNLKGIYPQSQIISGTIGLVILFTLMPLAIIFMSNRLIKYEKIEILRASAYKKKFRYGVNKALHNVTVLVVFIIFIHTLISHTSARSMLMRGVYFMFFDFTLIGWVYHKIVRKLRLETDPYVHRKVSWDIQAEIIPWLYQGTNNDWALQLIKQNPSLYPCLQCGTCTSECPISNYTKGEYNSRKLIQCLLKGLKDKIIIGRDPNVWQCTQCYTCVENCPQHVELPDIIIFLRNKLAERGEAPDGFLGEAKAVYNNGVSIPLQSAIIRRRKILGLPPIPKYDIQEIQDIMDMTGLKDLVTNHALVVKEDLDIKHNLGEKSEVESYIGSR